MIERVLNILDKNFLEVDILNGVRYIQEIFSEKNIKHFLICEEKILVGIITSRELVRSHPNRIAADVMSNNYICVESNLNLWYLKSQFDLKPSLDVIVVEKNERAIGIITRDILNIEIGKHIDALTGLYKSEYMFCNAYEFIKEEKNTTVTFMDLNNFGYIDKKYGHIVGDTILKDVARVLMANLDLSLNAHLCRYAGDEFAIVTQCSIDDSKSLAEKLMKSISEFEFSNNIPISVAVGIAEYKPKGIQVGNIWGIVDRLINTASLASTKAKKSTNNEIVIESLSY